MFWLAFELNLKRLRFPDSAGSQRFRQRSETLILEHVMQAELNLSRRRPYGADQPPRTVVYTIVRVPVAGNVEDVEEVRPEAKHMLLVPQMEVLKQGHVDLPIAWATLGTVMSSPESIRCSNAVSANSVIGTSGIHHRYGQAGLC